MKIVVLSSHTPSLFWFRMDMMQSFKNKGHEVYAVGNEDESVWREQFLEKGIKYYQIEVQRNGINPVSDLKTICSIKKVLKTICPDKVFVFQAKTVIYGGIAARMLGIKEIYPLIAGVGSVFLGKGIKNQIVRKILVLEYRIAMKKSAVVFFQNKDDEKLFRDNKIVHNQKVVKLNGSGVNLDNFKVQPLPEKFGFLCISRLIRDKGVYEYLEACEKVKEQYPLVKFMLVGPYDSNPSALKKEELTPFIDKGIIEYYGEQKDVRPYLEKCNVFVLPSYREGTPKTVLEAMACGRAIITTDAPGCKETVIDGQNGFLIPVKNVEALCEKMIYFIEHPEEIDKMGVEGRKRTEELFDVNIVNEVICASMSI